MRKTFSIRILLFGIILTAVFSLYLGFMAGTRKNWDAYEQRIALLNQKNEMLLRRQEELEKENTTESLNVIEPYAYILLPEEGFVAVYQSDRKTLYATTGILLETLPDYLQQEIQNGKIIENEEQLYNFLENYSS